MNIELQNKAKHKINVLFETGINKKAVFELFKELLYESNKRIFIIEDKRYTITENAFESELMIWKKNNCDNYSFDKFLKEVK